MQIGKNQVVVLGPPGCGKTTDLLRKVEKCLADGIDPRKIGFVSFTKKAVHEATQRASDKFNIPYDEFQFFKTIHSLCFFLLGMKRANIMARDSLKDFGEVVGYRFDGTFDESETGLPTGADVGDALLFLDNFARITMTPMVEVWKVAGIDVSWYEAERFSTCLKSYKESTGVMDFTDLLSRVISAKIKLKLDVVFIDEAQDLSLLQWHVLRSLFEDVPQVFIAGDDDQSIYKWSGADVNTFLTLPGNKELLKQSYRVPRDILNLALPIIRKVKMRNDKPYAARDEKGSLQTVQLIENLVIDESETTLLLARNVFLLKKYTEMLHNRGISYILRGGYSSVKKAHIEAIQAYEAVRRGESVYARQAKKFYDMLGIGSNLKRGSKATLEREHDETLVDKADLNARFGLSLDLPIWHDALDKIPVESREYYLSILRAKKKLTAKPMVSINTIHGVKGGEADHVVLLSDMAYRTYKEYQLEADNEHRVAYVGVTRSRNKLTIVQQQGKFAYEYRS